MTTSAIFWAAVGYANGLISQKRAFLGESYNRESNPQILLPAQPPPRIRSRAARCRQLVPLPRWEIFQPGEYFPRSSAAASRTTPTTRTSASPNPLEEAGKPDIRLGNRGRGTGSRISPGLINLHKTRLNDPHLVPRHERTSRRLRSSGCTRVTSSTRTIASRCTSGPWATAGHTGLSQSDDKSIRKTRRVHPIRHQLTRAVPTSQCMSCHMHQPNSFVNTYLGYIMWDYESDAELLWPRWPYPTEAEKRASLDHNPEGGGAAQVVDEHRFLEGLEPQPEQKHTQFADYHGHG